MTTTKILMMMFCMILLVGTISAMEWDNVKDYNPELKEVTITNALGLGDTIAKITLNTPLNNKVGLGYQKVAEFTINQTYDGTYEDALKGLKFYNIKDNMKSIERDYDYKYKVVEYIDATENDCTTDNDNKTTCVKNVIGKREIITWEDFGKDVIKGEITVGIFTHVEKGDHVEWIPSYYGVEIKEWAEWTASLNVDLISYYKLDNNDFSDSVGSNDGTNSGTTNTSGIIIDGRDFSGSSQYITHNQDFDGYFSANNAFSINVWGNADVTDANDCYFTNRESTSGTFIQLCLGADGQLITGLKTGSGEQLTCTSANGVVGDNLDVMVTLVYFGNETSATYVNGTMVCGTTETDLDLGGTFANQDFMFGRIETQYYNGMMDEIGFWDRAITGSEVTQLYNGGDGMTYTEYFDDPPIVSLNYPTANLNLSSADVTFNCSASDDINLVNVSLYIDGVINETNSSGINNTYYYFDKTFI